MVIVLRNVLMAGCAFLFVLLPGPCRAGNDAMTIALPGEVIRQSLQEILPLRIEQDSSYLEGTFILTSISRVIMGENSAVFDGIVDGSDVHAVTRVGNQNLRIKVGNVHLPLTCDIGFRFDAQQKVLFVKPRVRPPAPGGVADMAGTVASLLSLFGNKEYPVSLTSLQTLNARVGDQDIAIDMDPVDVRVTGGQLVVKLVPRISKND